MKKIYRKKRRKKKVTNPQSPLSRVKENKNGGAPEKSVVLVAVVKEAGRRLRKVHAVTARKAARLAMARKGFPTVSGL